MKADEVRFAEAVAALRARLEAWGVEGAAEKAQTFLVDMRHQGWRPRALAVVSPEWGRRGIPADVHQDELKEAREKLRAETAAYHAKAQALADERAALKNQPGGDNA